VPRERVGRLGVLLQGALELTAEHDLDHLLERTVQRAAEVAGARFAALGVYDAEGRIERFTHVGIDTATVARIGHTPEGRGLLGEVIVADGPIRLADLRADPRSVGFPAHHPDMRSFLGVPVRLGNRRFGNLYVTEKHDGGGFDAEDERLVVTLAAFAAAAIDAALLVATERDLAAAQERARAQSGMLARVIDAQEAERARVARDLHDQIGQSLTSVLLGLRLVDGSLASETPDVDDVRAHTADVRALVGQALDEVRRLAFDLRPTVLDDLGLVAAVRRLASDHTERHGLPVELTLVGLDDDTRLEPVVETGVYRVVQEALTNVARHAHASRAEVELAVEEDHRVRATVADDGVGFAVDAGMVGSLGLAGMRERASLVGGRLDVVSGRGEGTTVVLSVPG
jgi:signal transduction histidine kinase